MMTFWRLIDSGCCEAAYNMALDEAIAAAVRHCKAPPTLRFYGWERPSVTIGSFQKIGDVDLEYCARNTIPVVRRPTGGRGILHGDELTYSFSSRNEGFFSKGLLEAYGNISEALMSGLSLLGIAVTKKGVRESGRTLTRSPLCFNASSFGEISCGGKKIIGSAQRRWVDGFLQQGSIPYSLDYGTIAEVFKISRQSKGEDHRQGSRPPAHPSAKGNCGGSDDSSMPSHMAGLKELLRVFNPEGVKDSLRDSFEEHFGVTLVAAQPSLQEQETALQLARGKYRNPRWTQERTVNSR